MQLVDHLSGAKRIFVLGTDTDVGKTHVCTRLVQEFLTLSKKVNYCKPVQTGDSDSDSEFVTRSIHHPHFLLTPTLYSYKAPLSPDQAASLETHSKQVEVDSALSHLRGIDAEIVIAEGAGGLLVPLNQQGETWLNLLEKLDFSIVLVALNRVGAINHTALTIEGLASKNLEPRLVILNGEEPELNQTSLKRMYPKINFVTIPWTKVLPNAEAAQQILQDDARYTWHPYTQHGLNEEPIVVFSAQKNWLHTNKGKLWDGVGSWWVNTIGHSHPRIGKAIYSQQQRMDQVIFAGMTHAPAVELSKKICQSAGVEWYQRVFYSDNGSTAVEVALKIAYQRAVLRGEKHRTRFLGLSSAYHGDTIGCMSVGGAGLHDDFAPLMFQCDRLDPLTRHESQYNTDFLSKNKTRDAVRRYFAEHAHNCVAVLVEPLVQGAGGMLMQDRSWLEFLCINAQLHGIPVIFDEVFCGMGRLGTMWAFEQTNIRPDIFCAAKGLTGGTMPLAVTVTKEEYFADFVSADRAQALLHGHSYTGNPIACAAALEVMRIYEDEQILENCKKMEEIYFAWCAEGQTGVHQPRTHGSIFAFDLEPNEKKLGASKTYFQESGRIFAQKLLKKGIFLRALGNCVYLTPALNTEPSELTWVLEQIRQTLAE